MNDMTLEQLQQREADLWRNVEYLQEQKDRVDAMYVEAIHNATNIWSPVHTAITKAQMKAQVRAELLKEQQTQG